MITALDHVQLAAPPGSEPVLRRYYADTLGLQEIPKPPVLAARGGCWFRTPGGGVQLHLGVETPSSPPGKPTPPCASRASTPTRKASPPSDPP